MELFGHQIRFAIDTLRGAVKKSPDNPGTPVVGRQVKSVRDTIRCEREKKHAKAHLPSGD